MHLIGLIPTWICWYKAEAAEAMAGAEAAVVVQVVKVVKEVKEVKVWLMVVGRRRDVTTGPRRTVFEKKRRGGG
jgi:hypothetical protein